jgi:hypothetical protein
MRRLRFTPPNQLVELTCRTFQGFLFLLPGERWNDVFLGVLGRAQRLYGMEIHFGSTLLDRYSLLLSPSSRLQFARFLAHFNGNLARELCRLTGWSTVVWARRWLRFAEHTDAAAQLARLRGLLALPVRERLVARPADWPGPDFLGALLAGRALGGTWFNRTAARQARKGAAPGEFEAQEQVTLSPLPCWRGTAAELWRGELQALVAGIEPGTGYPPKLDWQSPLRPTATDTSFGESPSRRHGLSRWSFQGRPPAPQPPYSTRAVFTWRPPRTRLATS